MLTNISMPSFALLPTGGQCVTGNIIIGGEIVASTTYCWNTYGPGGGGGIVYTDGWSSGGSSGSSPGVPVNEGGENISESYMPSQHQYVTCSNMSELRQHAASAAFNAWALANLNGFQRLHPNSHYYRIHFNGGSQLYQWVANSLTVSMIPNSHLPCQPD